VGSAFSVELTALIVLALLILVMRWVFGGGKRRYRRVPIDAAQSDELGLLTVVAPSLDRDAAIRTRARLGEADIRSSMSRRRDGRFDVLVFDADLEQARTLLR
jgi:hypothetical protein